MKIKLFTLFLALTANIGTILASIKIGDLYYNLNETELTAEVTNPSEDKYSGSISIPSFVYDDGKKYSVTSIGDGAFGLCENITSIEIPNSVTSIGSTAFYGCTGMFSVTIPNSVTSIGDLAFAYCRGLISVTIPNSVTSIGNHAFDGCHSLASVTIPNSVTNIGREAFAYCKSLTSVTIPNSLTSIKEYTFRGCSGLTSVTIPSSITSIGGAAFSDCTGLTAVYISDIVAWCGISFNDYGTSNPLKYAHNLYLNGELVKDLVIPESVTSISSSAFSGCTGLTSITIPNTVTSIGEGAFYNVANIVYEGTATGAPWGARSMNGYVDGWLVYKDASKTQLLACSSAAKGEISIPNSVTCIGNYAFTYCTGLTSVTIPNSVTSIGKWAFYGCSGLTAIEIPSSIASIEESAFSGCTGLTAVYISDIAAWCGISFNGLGETPNPLKYAHNLYLNGELVKDLVIPESVTSISSTAFYGCTSITSVTIPNSVTSIGIGAFWGCAGLTYIIALPQTPPSLAYSSTFPNNTTIYVPNEFAETYQSAKYWKDFTIKPLFETKITVGSTSVSVNVNHNVWNNKGEYITSVGVKGGETFDGNVLEYNGLEPNSEYTNVPVVVTSNTGETESFNVSFTTTALTLTTQESKAVSSTTAILLAETNISDAEVSCGFEYKRNDAPEGFTPTKVYCPVSSGTMAGRLKNLKDEVYYKYRAFYQSAAGNMYYGEWKYIFTGDVTVDFDPILYTYAPVVVSENKAILKGYALAGSEDFTEQGFEYWAESRAPKADAPLRMPAALGEHSFVKASGISMSVTLDNLDAGTVYKYRVYAKAGDQVLYGPEQSFTTQGEYIDETTAIEEIQSIDKAVPQAQKVLRNGHLLILSGDKIYTITGQEVK